jgi:hypothetical protein
MALLGACLSGRQAWATGLSLQVLVRSSLWAFRYYPLPNDPTLQTRVTFCSLDSNIKKILSKFEAWRGLFIECLLNVNN